MLIMNREAAPMNCNVISTIYNDDAALRKKGRNFEYLYVICIQREGNTGRRQWECINYR
jgi:hypothetical protein